MALSEYEQRKLDEIERSLHGDDPALARILDSGKVRRRRRSVAVVVFVAGLVGLIGGVVAALSLPLLGVVISVVGFVAMGAGTWLLVSGRSGPGRPSGAGRARGFGNVAFLAYPDGAAVPGPLRRSRPVVDRRSLSPRR